MPVYEYECEKCAYRFELKSRFNEHIENPCCPICQGKVRQLYSPAGLLFKGSGFYITESRSNNNLPPEEGKTDKVDNVKKGEGKADKADVGTKEVDKADKVQKSKNLDNN